MRTEVSVLQDYDVAADAKNRINLRGAKVKYFHVRVLSDGGYLLQPRVLVPPDAIPPRTLKMLERSVAQLKHGKASAPVDFGRFPQGLSTMGFKVRMGQPEMENLWNDLSTRKRLGELGREEERLFKKLLKALGFLSANPAAC